MLSILTLACLWRHHRRFHTFFGTTCCDLFYYKLVFRFHCFLYIWNTPHSSKLIYLTVRFNQYTLTVWIYIWPFAFDPLSTYKKPIIWRKNGNLLFIQLNWGNSTPSQFALALKTLWCYAFLIKKKSCRPLLRPVYIGLDKKTTIWVDSWKPLNVSNTVMKLKSSHSWFFFRLWKLPQ